MRVGDAIALGLADCAEVGAGVGETPLVLTALGLANCAEVGVGEGETPLVLPALGVPQAMRTIWTRSANLLIHV